jgi:predicted ATPase
MLIATRRSQDATSPEHPLESLQDDLLVHNLGREIIVQPLAEAEVAEYLAGGSSSDSLPQGLAKLLYHHTEGNPLFLVAALEHMRERGLLHGGGGSWNLRVPLQEIALEVPPKLRRMLEAQICSLPDEEQRALEVASVEGVAFSVGVSAVAANLDPEAFEDLCERLSRRKHIVQRAEPQHPQDGGPCHTYQFVHALYREVLYRRQAPGRRAKHHQRMAEQLQALHSNGSLSEVAAGLSYHLGKGLRLVKRD